MLYTDKWLTYLSETVGSQWMKLNVLDEREVAFTAGLNVFCSKGKTTQAKQVDVLFKDCQNDDILTGWHPLAFTAKASAADNPTYNDILATTSEEQELWYDAMDEELDSLMSMQAFEVVSRPTNLKKGDNILILHGHLKERDFQMDPLKS